MGTEISAELFFEREINEEEVRRHVPISAWGRFGTHDWSFYFEGSSFTSDFIMGLPGLVKAVGPIEGKVEIDGWPIRVSKTGLLPGWTSKKEITWAICSGCGTKVSGKKVCHSCAWDKMTARKEEWSQKLGELVGKDKLLELDGECSKCQRGRTLRIPCQCGELHCEGCYTGSIRNVDLCKYAAVTERLQPQPRPRPDLPPKLRDEDRKQCSRCTRLTHGTCLECGTSPLCGLCNKGGAGKCPTCTC